MTTLQVILSCCAPRLAPSLPSPSQISSPEEKEFLDLTHFMVLRPSKFTVSLNMILFMKYEACLLNEGH